MDEKRLEKINLKIEKLHQKILKFEKKVDNLKIARYRIQSDIDIAKMKGRWKMLHIKLEDDLKKELKKEAEEKGLKLNTYIRMLLLERNKNEKWVFRKIKGIRRF